MADYPFALASPVTTLTAGNGTGVDATPAWAAAIAAATANGSTLQIAPGTYTINGPLPLTGPVRIVGLGQGLGNQSGASTPAPAVIINSNGGAGGTGHLFTFPFQGYLWGGLEIENISVNYTGTGNVFNLLNITDSLFRNMLITMTTGAAMAFFTTGSASFLNILFERVNIVTTAAVRSNPMVSIASSIAASVSNNTFFKCKFSNNGLDNTQYMIYFACTAAGGGQYHYEDNLIDCWFERPFGGAYQCLSGQNIKVDGCMVWDIFTGATVGNSTFYFGAYQPSSNSGTQGVRVVSCGRSLAGPNGTTTWDIFCEATTSQVVIEGWVNRASSVSTYSPAFFNLNGCNDVTLTANQSPQGVGINGNSNTVITNPSPTQAIISQGVLALPAGSFEPSDASFLEWAYDAASIHNAGSAVSGTVQAIRITVRRPITVTNVVLFQQAAGVTLTAAENFVGLYTSAGVQVGVSADQSAAWAAGVSTYKIMALTGGPFILAPGYYWVLALANAATTPTWGFNNSFTPNAANAGIGSIGARWATGAAAQTALPASFTPGTYLTGTQVTYWAGLS